MEDLYEYSRTAKELRTVKYRVMLTKDDIDYYVAIYKTAKMQKEFDYVALTEYDEILVDEAFWSIIEAYEGVEMIDTDTDVVVDPGTPMLLHADLQTEEKHYEDF